MPLPTAEPPLDDVDALQAENAYWEGLRDAVEATPDDDDERCWTCAGEQFVLVGVDIDVEDAINGPFEGETIACPNCGGSGKGADCTYW